MNRKEMVKVSIFYCTIGDGLKIKPERNRRYYEGLYDAIEDCPEGKFNKAIMAI